MHNQNDFAESLFSFDKLYGLYTNLGTIDKPVF